MIQITDKTTANTIYFPINGAKNPQNVYVLTLKTEAYANTFTKNITDIGTSSKYIKSSVDVSDVPDGEYSYSITNGTNIYSEGMFGIGDYIDEEIYYNYSSTFYEYDPESGESIVVNPLNLASIITGVSANSTYTINTPSGYDGIKNVQIEVNISGGSVNDKFKKLLDTQQMYDVETLTAEDLSGIISNRMYAFAYTRLKHVFLPSTFATLNRYSFYECRQLESIDLGSIITIGAYCFSNCKALTGVVFPSTLGSIENAAFVNCISLTTLSLPSSLISIGIGVFSGCENLTSITCNRTTPPTIGTNVFQNTNNCPIYVPAESVNAYKTATNWSTYANRIQAIQ